MCDLQMSDLELIEDIKEYLSNADIDFNIPFSENNFQIFNDLIIIYELDNNITEEKLCFKYNLQNFARFVGV